MNINDQIIYRDATGEAATGIVRGVSESGQLTVESPFTRQTVYLHKEDALTLRIALGKKLPVRKP